jgi:hypothetical protein
MKRRRGKSFREQAAAHKRFGERLLVGAGLLITRLDGSIEQVQEGGGRKQIKPQTKASK